MAIHVFAKNDKQRKFSTVELLRLALMYYWCCPAIFDTHSEKGDQHFASGEVGFEAHAKSSMYLLVSSTLQYPVSVQIY